MKICFENFKKWRTLDFYDNHFDEEEHVSHVCSDKTFFVCLYDVLGEHLDAKQTRIIMSRILCGFNQYWIKCNGHDYFSREYTKRKLSDLSDTQIEKFLERVQNEMTDTEFFPVITTRPSAKEDDETKYY